MALSVIINKWKKSTQIFLNLCQNQFTIGVSRVIRYRNQNFVLQILSKGKLVESCLLMRYGSITFVTFTFDYGSAYHYCASRTNLFLMEVEFDKKCIVHRSSEMWDLRLMYIFQTSIEGEMSQNNIFQKGIFWSFPTDPISSKLTKKYNFGESSCGTEWYNWL